MPPSRYHPERAWRCWYHCMANTYGTWLPGDDRGFRHRHHRKHVEGDYKSPPPVGLHAPLADAARRDLKRDPVRLTAEAQLVACSAFGAALHKPGITIGELVVTEVHVHVVAQFPFELWRDAAGDDGDRSSALDDPPRHYIGIAKRKSAAELRLQGFVPEGGAWATRGKIVPVDDERHFDHLVGLYLPRHVEREGGVLWSMLEHRGDRESPA